jgi:hypothetical protein
MRQFDCERRFVCGIQTVADSDDINVSIYQGNEFRNLLHIKLAFTRATDSEARAWLSRK